MPGPERDDPLERATDAAVVEEAVEGLRGEALRRLADVRLAGAVLFLAISTWLAFADGLADWRIYVLPHASYSVLALGLRLASRPRLNAWAVPLLDVPAVFLLQFVSMPLSPFPAGVAGWTLGIFVFFAVLSALALERQVLVATWIMTCATEAMLQRAAGVGWGAVVASAVVLGLAAAVTAMAAHRLVSLIDRLVSSEVGRRIAERHNEELARANAEVARVNEELLEAQRNAETLTNLLVHDMKGPLTAVLGAFDLTEMRLESPEEVGEIGVDLATGRRAAERLLDMIGDLLGIARLEQTGFEPELAETDLSALARDVANDHAHAATRRDIALSVDAPATSTARVDAYMVRRALDNLVSNAVSYAPRQGRVELRVEKSAGATRLVVRNDGPPIPAEFRDRLFRKHSAAGARRGHNAGLGLYLCSLVATAHGGEVALVDDPGWATSFAITLPEAASGLASASGRGRQES